MALRLCIVIVLVGVLCNGFEPGQYTIPPSDQPSPLYPEWAHHHWVWLSSSQANQTSEMQFVNDFLAYDIPVGAVDIDSQWATADNNFVWNTKVYPNPQQMIDYFHSKGVRVILWTTSVIDTNSPNYAEGLAKGYYLSGLDGNTVKWWHGVGSFIDYTNPAALEWWHSQLDNVINMGIDGWKCDGTDPYIYELIIAYGHSGIISERQYADLYYRDFFYYTRSKNPEALIMSRPVDSYDMLYLDFSPRDVVFSGWVGDQDPTFAGLQDALRNMFHSAWANYVGFGSDIGGYRCCGPPPFGRTKELFIRWAQLGAFNSLMENGGDDEHRPWKFDNTNETVNIYRNFVNFHMELSTYLYQAGALAYAQNVSIMKPIAGWTDFTPSSWDFWLWHDVFVAPVVSAGGSVRTVEFPSGNNYVDWWNSSIVYTGGSTVNYPIPLDRFPVFHRKGSILPLQVVTDEGVRHGDQRSSDAITLLVKYLNSGTEKTGIREWQGVSQEVEYRYEEATGMLKMTFTAHKRNLIVLIHGVDVHDGGDVWRHDRQLTRLKNVDQLHESGEGWVLDRENEEVWIRPGDGEYGLVLNISKIKNIR
eukprot:TRINITY_DN7769_c0_g1_i2.p1 TRINITY_DN7769_c0_g1~~TRINITY_DN7769_c0_g1_i2.p1  ORF type:complete len:588 (-),score=108.30 TRINITY_DN7769_c0_g1_i2:90-1853(-)